MHLDNSQLTDGFGLYLGNQQIISVRKINKHAKDVRKILDAIKAFVWDDSDTSKTQNHSQSKEETHIEHNSPKKYAPSREPLPLKPIIITASIIAALGISFLIFSLTKAGKQLLCSHSYVSTVTEATCTNLGYTTYSCPKCDKIKTDDYTSELGHIFSATELIEPATCTKNGTQYRECIVCGHYEHIPVLTQGHSYSEWVTDKEATDSETGLRYTICNVCNERIEEMIYSTGSVGLSYEKQDDHYIVTGIGGCRDVNIVIASSVDGYPVTEIADKAFKGTDIATIIIPEGVERIGKKAFYGCSTLNKVTMPKSLKTIEKKAFAGCGLKSLVISENVNEIAAGAFKMCVSLENVTLSKNIKRIGTGCFTDCWKLKEITYDNTVDAWDEISVGLFAFNTGRNLFFSSTTIYCTDGRIEK